MLVTYNKNIKIITLIIVLPGSTRCEAMKQAIFIINYQFNTFKTDTCLLISWKSSPALIVLSTFLND